MVQRVDMLIAGVLIAAAAASAFGVATYEDDRQGGLFRVTWDETRVPVTAPPASRTGGGEVTVLLPVPVANLTRVDLEVTLRGAAARLQPVEVLVEVLLPNGTVALQEETRLEAGPQGERTIPLSVPLAERPPAEEVRAASPNAAVSAASGRLGNATQGDWTIRVTFAPGAPGPAAGVETFTVQVQGAAVGVAASASPVTPEVRR